MSNRPGAVGRPGGAGRGGPEKRNLGKPKTTRKATGYTSDTEAIKNGIFDCGKPEHAAAFERSLKRVADYIRREGDKESVLVAEGIETFSTPTIPIPTMPGRIEDPINPGVMIENRGAMIMWEGELRHLPTRRNDLRNGLVQSYAIIWNQCTPTMKSKLEQHPDYPNFNATKDPIALITEMRNIVCGKEAHTQDAWSLCKLIKFMLGEYQKELETNEGWMERFHGMWEAVKQHGGSIWSHQSLIRDRAQDIAGAGNVPTQDQIRQAEEAVEHEMKAMFMLAGANKGRHSKLRTHLENSYTVGRNEYPANTTELLSMMNNWKTDSEQKQYSHAQVRYEDDDGLTFAQEGEQTGNDEKAGAEKKGVTMVQSKNERRKGVLRTSTYQKGGGLEKKPCVHCGGEHGLVHCPEITRTQRVIGTAR